MIEVYAHRKNASLAAGLVAQFRANGQGSRMALSKNFDPKQMDKNVAYVYHDGTDPLIPWTFERAGVTCELIPGIAGGHTSSAEVEPFYLSKTPVGFQLMGPTGPVGAPQPTEDEAWSLRESPLEAPAEGKAGRKSRRTAAMKEAGE